MSTLTSHPMAGSSPLSSEPQNEVLDMNICFDGLGAAIDGIGLAWNRMNLAKARHSASLLEGCDKQRVLSRAMERVICDMEQVIEKIDETAIAISNIEKFRNSAQACFFGNIDEDKMGVTRSLDWVGDVLIDISAFLPQSPNARLNPSPRIPRKQASLASECDLEP